MTAGVPSPETRAGVGQAQATLTQPIYSGGRTHAATSQSEAQVVAQRARLINQGQQTLGATVNAYVGFIVSQQVLLLAVNNELVLQRQLQVVDDRFHVGDVTTTDLVQAVAALAGATSQRQNAQGQLQNACATYARGSARYLARTCSVPSRCTFR